MNEQPEITLDDMVSQLGGSPAPAVETPAVETPAVETPAVETPAVETPAAPVVETPATSKPPETPAVQQPDNKVQQAFAAMRVQNKQMTDTLKGVAGVLGLETIPEDSTQLLEALQQKIVASQAVKQGVPVEMLTRLNQLEQRDQVRVAQQLESEAALGFQALQNKFTLSQEELNKFAQELVAAGKSPLTQSVNMVQEYQTLHFEELQAKAVAKAIAEEQERSSKANQHSSNPGSTTGAGGTGVGDTGKVNTVHELENWFKNQPRN